MEWILWAYPIVGLITAPMFGMHYYRRARAKAKGDRYATQPSAAEWSVFGFLQSIVWPIALLVMGYTWILHGEDRREAKEKAEAEKIAHARKVIAEYERNLKNQYPQSPSAIQPRQWGGN